MGEPGLLLGAVDDYAGARDVASRWHPGDTLLLFTDGVTDTPGEDGRFGDAGLQAAVAARRRGRPRRCSRAITAPRSPSSSAAP